MLCIVGFYFSPWNIQSKPVSLIWEVLPITIKEIYASGGIQEMFPNACRLYRQCVLPTTIDVAEA